MRSIKHVLLACAAAAVLTGCYTAHQDYDAQGRPYYGEDGIYHGTYEEPVIDGLNRGVNTNWFGPVNSGPEAASGVGTPSGTYGR